MSKHGSARAGLTGAAIVAMERVLERRVVWATAQYLSYALIDEVGLAHSGSEANRPPLSSVKCRTSIRYFVSQVRKIHRQ